ncbi:MAG: heme ABC transporter ATP-binding protein [Thermoleophilia bacterium]|nr:heme ABC transporter ATP-binding protein [Thermoleophilia bacterium]
MTGTMLHATGLTHGFGHRTVLDDVTLDGAAGEVVAIIGPNGAGKSTLLAALAGDLRPAAGEVRLLGRTAGEWGARRLAGIRAVLTQQWSVEFPFTARQIVEMGCTAWSGRRPAGGVGEAVAAALAAADVAHLADAPVTAMSVGERARVGLARVLAQDARILLLDEPTAALDIRHQHHVLAVARAQAATGRLVVVVLHDLNLAAAYADRIALMVAGRIEALGDPHRVLTADGLEAAFRHPIAVAHSATGVVTVNPAARSAAAVA